MAKRKKKVSRLRKISGRFSDKPLTFLFLGFLLTATLTGSMLFIFPDHLFQEGEGLMMIPRMARAAIAVFLLIFSFMPITAMAFACAYRVKGLKTVILATKRVSILLHTMAHALMILLLPAIFIIPGIIMNTRFSLILPVIANENKTGFEALRRSSGLVRGYTGRLIWDMMLLGLTALITMIASTIFLITTTHTVETQSLLTGNSLTALRIGVFAIPIAVLSMIFVPSWVMLMQVSYEDFIKMPRRIKPEKHKVRYLRYKSLAVLGTFVAMSAGAAGMISHPEIFIDPKSYTLEVSDTTRRGPLDNDVLAHAALEANENVEWAPSERDRDMQRYKDVYEMRTALMNFAKDNGLYPDNIYDLVPDFMETIPHDPSEDHIYRYMKVNNEYFKLTFLMEEGVKGLAKGNHFITPDGIDFYDAPSFASGSAKHVAASKPEPVPTITKPKTTPDPIQPKVTPPPIQPTETQQEQEDPPTQEPPPEIIETPTEPIPQPTVDPIPARDTNEHSLTDSQRTAYDLDGDGVSNNAERSFGTDPRDADSDDDGLTDGDELMFYDTNPLKKDTDGDGYDDKTEIESGNDPTEG
jgi:hypothetical protein